MQGIREFIPTEVKVNYLNTLLSVGFDTIDCGSFVSPKAIPQMADTGEVIKKLSIRNAKSKLLTIVANKRGAVDSSHYDEVHYLGYPLSLSETFQQRNTNKSIAAAFDDIEFIQNLCAKSRKVLVCYISMGFGNPYGDPYDMGYVGEFVKRLAELEVKVISLADTIGVSNIENITYLFNSVIPAFPHIEFGAHLHSHPVSAREKIEAAYKAGCRRFDGAIRGFGGCPMANDSLVGNIATETIIDYFESNDISLPLNKENFSKAMKLAGEVFPA